MAPWLICHFIVMLVYNQRKVASYEKFSHNFILEVRIFWEISVFQCYWSKYQNAGIYLNFQKFLLKWKVLKYFTRPKQRVASRKLFAPPPSHQVKASKSLEQTFYCGKCSSLASRKQVCGKFCKVSKFLAVLRQYVFLKCWVSWGL